MTQIKAKEQLVDNVFFVPRRLGTLIVEKVTAVMITKEQNVNRICLKFIMKLVHSLRNNMGFERKKNLIFGGGGRVSDYFFFS